MIFVDQDPAAIQYVPQIKETAVIIRILENEPVRESS